MRSLSHSHYRETGKTESAEPRRSLELRAPGPSSVSVSISNFHVYLFRPLQTHNQEIYNKEPAADLSTLVNLAVESVDKTNLY